MPVILRPDDEDRWLDPNLKDTKELLSMLKPYPSEEMDGYPVSRAMSSPAFNGPECVAPIESVEHDHAAAKARLRYGRALL